MKKIQIEGKMDEVAYFGIKIIAYKCCSSLAGIPYRIKCIINKLKSTNRALDGTP